MYEGAMLYQINVIFSLYILKMNLYIDLKIRIIKNTLLYSLNYFSTFRHLINVNIIICSKMITKKKRKKIIIKINIITVIVAFIISGLFLRRFNVPSDSIARKNSGVSQKIFFTSFSPFSQFIFITRSNLYRDINLSYLFPTRYIPQIFIITQKIF